MGSEKKRECVHIPLPFSHLAALGHGLMRMLPLSPGASAFGAC